MNSQDSNKFLKLLEEHHDWPCHYMFKFVVKAELLQLVLDLFDEEPTKITPSRSGTYVSVTAHVYLNSPTQVIEIYNRAKTIEGIVSL